MTLPPGLIRQRAFPWLIALLSLAVSAWLIAIDPVLDNDGVLYLVAAETFVAEGFRASVDIYHWPFLQMLIGTLHAVTGLAPGSAGLLIVSLCYALLAVAFVRTVKEMGGGPLTQLLAVLVVVFHAQVGADRSAIARDAGMLAFMLLALVELIRYGKTGLWRHAGLWTLYISAAFLFRVEALSIALLSPLGLLLGDAPLRERAARLASLLALPCALLAGTAAAIGLLAPDLLASLKVAEDLGLFHREALHFSQRLARMAEQLASSGLLRHTSVDDAAWGVVAVMVTLFALNLMRAITLPYALLLLYQWRGKPALHLCPVSDRLIRVHLAIIVIYQLAFIFFYQFSLGRYSLQIAILLLLYVPLVLARWWQAAAPRSVARILIVLLLCGYAVDALVNSRYKKTYIAEAAEWLRTAPLADDLAVVSNDHHIGYASGRLRRDDILLSRHNAEFDQAHTPWQPGTFYAYRTPRQTDMTALRAGIRRAGGEIHREFEGGDRRHIVMFSLPAK